MINCIVLDGWHKGHTVQMPRLFPRIILLRPPVITVDYCCDGEVFSEADKSKLEYNLAFTSVDGKTALYTKDGSSTAFESRDWISPIDKNWVEQPLYVGMHDPRAVIEDSPTPHTERKEA